MYISRREPFQKFPKSLFFVSYDIIFYLQQQQPQQQPPQQQPAQPQQQEPRGKESKPTPEGSGIKPVEFGVSVGFE
jgi:hypothetical protein